MPGNWIMVVLTGGLAWWYWDQRMFGVPVLVAVVVLALIGELLEFVSSAAAVKRVGGSRSAGAGAIVGALFGGIAATVLIPIPLVGSLIGACGGAFLGAWFVETAGGKSGADSVRAGAGAAVGRFAGLSLKFAVGAVMWVIITVAAFWA